MPRRQLPVYSPVTVSALAAGASAALVGDRSRRLIDRLRGALASRYDARDVLLTDSGTSALRLAISGAAALRAGPVGLPAYSCFDLSTAAEGAGARVALYDLDPRTLGPAPGAIEGLVARRASTLVAAHLMGYSVDVPAMVAAAKDALVIEDAAQGAGGRLHGKLLGSFGSVSVLSFGRGKGMTGGGGGALLAHDEQGSEVLRRAREVLPREHEGRGMVKLLNLAAQWALGRPSLYWIPAGLPFLHLGETAYHPPRSPRGMATACLGVLEQLIHESDREVGIRKANAERLLRSVSTRTQVEPVEPIPGAEPGWLRLPFLAGDRALKRRLLKLGETRGVSGMYPDTLDQLPSLAGFLDPGAGRYPGAAALVERLVALPTHRLVREADSSRLEELLGG